MFSIAILIGIYSYLIFALGILGLLYKPYILLLTAVFLVASVVIHKKPIASFFKKIHAFKFPNKVSIATFFVSLIVVQMLVNLIGVLGPEISFDALWYHLTLPKLYLLNHSITFIDGGLLNYSVMPKLIDMLYVLGLSLGSEIYAKLIHYLFGLLCFVSIYKLSREFLDKKNSILSVLIFSSSLVIGWEMIAAYIDLGRTFFEILTVWAFIKWIKSRDIKWLYESAVVMGLAIATKLIAILSLLILLVLIPVYGLSVNKKIKNIFFQMLTFMLIALIVPLPWFILSFLSTSNPFYPYFTNIPFPLTSLMYVINPIVFVKEIGSLFVWSSDPISPIYLITLPLLIGFYRMYKFNEKILFLYSLIGFLITCFLGVLGNIIPEIKGGSRFLIPYLATYSVLIPVTVSLIKNIKIRKFLVSLIIILSLASISYRMIANSKFLPVIYGTETKKDFLEDNLNFKYGDFYDTDEFFNNFIKKDDKVLLYGFHNLYYINFPFIDSSWVKSGDGFNYIATQNTDLPKRFKNWTLIYQNATTGVKLYNHYGLRWHY